MKTVMLLAPHLTTFTYACPYLIPSVAVQAGAQPISVRTAVPRAVRAPAALPDNFDISIKRPLSVPARDKPNNLLFLQDDAWRSSATSDFDSVDFANVDISDSKLEANTAPSGATSWKVESPITFEYTVQETLDVLNPANDALLFGHIADAATRARARSRPLKRVVVVDEAVHALYGERIEAYFAHYEVETRLLVLPTTEENKDIEMVLKIAETIHDLGIDRRLDPVIAIGGGVCMDIVGFAASIYRRRTPYIRVPTTVMGYVDASVGAKSGVNFAGKKNKLGAYMPPVLTLLDRSFLATLDERQVANGAAEIVKMALVKDPELFQLLHAHGPALIEHKFQDTALEVLSASSANGLGASAASRVLYLAIQTMLEELAPNLWEDSLERLVDFGHVFSMELEMAVLFDEKLFHGEAVSIDMAFSSVLSYVRGDLEEAHLDEILEMMRGLKLPVYHPLFDAAMVDEAMYERNKFSQGQKLPLPVGRGVSRIFNDITNEQLLAALDEWKARCA